MNERVNLSPREAGSLIASSGLADDVIRADHEQIKQRRGRQREEADDAEPRARRRAERDDTDEDAAPRKAKKKQPVREEIVEEDEFEDEDDADSSNREDGESDEVDDDEEPAEEGDEAEDADDDDRADPVEGEHVVKVNGKEFTVTTKELVAGYQRSKDYHQKTAALATKGRELHEGHAKVAEQYTARLQRAGAVIGGVRNLLIGDMDSNEMQNLLRTDPQQWQIQRTLMEDRVKKVDQVLHGLNTEHERHVGELTQQQKRNLAATLGQERELIVKAIPDWDTKGKARLATYLIGSGFKNEELVNVTDHRMLTIADKARKWDAYEANRSAEPKRKLRTVPKSIKPGTSQIRRQGTEKVKTRSEYRRLADHAKKTGDTRDAGRAIARLLK